MRLIGEARHGIIGLRREPGAGDAPRGKRLEHWKASATGQAMDNRRDENRLAGARQARDPEPHRRIGEMAAEILDRARGEPRLFQQR
jgi:hypothetical protein